MGRVLLRVLPGAAAAAIATVSVVAFDAAFTGDTGAARLPSADGPVGDQQPGGSRPRTQQAPSNEPADCTTADRMTGPAVGTPWGPVQVVAVVDAAGGICSTTAAAYPASDPRSQMINSRAVPLLNQSAQRDGVEFDAVSGATYTSEAYRQSLQSILDSL